jgi:glycosyltransferase involved in cell wall biosynthesis
MPDRYAMRVDALLIGERTRLVEWSLGTVTTCLAEVEDVDRHLRALGNESEAEAFLLCAANSSLPATGTVLQLLQRDIDVWHSGLLMGMQRKPQVVDLVSPVWMLNADVDPGIEGTSWRLPPGPVLFRRTVFKQLGGLNCSFRSLEGAMLDLGHRMVSKGVIMRHTPLLMSEPRHNHGGDIPCQDEALFACLRFGTKWALWGTLRGLMGGCWTWKRALTMMGVIHSAARVAEDDPFVGLRNGIGVATHRPGVTVLIPTVERYPYLRVVLDQLRRQTVMPLEVIVVDQTPVDHRDASILSEFLDLPLRWFELDPPGQCSARNLGLRASRGEYILFLDDDDEIGPTLIQDHLLALSTLGADVSCGVADERGAGPLPPEFEMRRVSDVFPTNNSMVRRSALVRSGLFDLAYETGQRADGDLGMRLHLTGALMVLDNKIRVLHHHARQGGLRLHKARAVTYASSRTCLLDRQLTSSTEFYLAERYFGPSAVSEIFWQSVLGTFSIHGSFGRKLLKSIIGLIMIGSTLRRLITNLNVAREMLKRYPDIPSLDSQESQPH